MRKKPNFLVADPVRKKRESWQQINISAFAKKMNAQLILNAENCCDTYHQNCFRRNGDEYRKHPKRVLRSFIFYTMVESRMTFDHQMEQESSGVLLHDTIEDVSSKILENISNAYGTITLDFVNVLSRGEKESVISFVKRVIRRPNTALGKFCDSIDNGIGMLDEYYAGIPSEDLNRLKTYMHKKIFPLIVVGYNTDLGTSKYAQAARWALSDLILCYREAQEAIRIAEE